MCAAVHVWTEVPWILQDWAQSKQMLLRLLLQRVG